MNNKRREFSIARIEDDEEEVVKPKDKFVSPYGGSKTKDEISYPHVRYENDARQYRGLDAKYDQSKTKNDEKVVDKYDRSRIPSYYVRDYDAGISQSNIADLRGDVRSKEEEIELNRRRYSGYQSAYEKIITPEAPKNEDRIIDLLNEKQPTEDSVETYDEVEKQETNFSHMDNPKILSVEENEKEEEYEEPKEVEKPKVPEKPKVIDVTPIIKAKKKSDYVFPSFNLLEKSTKQAFTNEGTQEHVDAINKVLQDFKVGGRVINYTKGPTVTQYEIGLDPGVNVNKIDGLTRNLQMALKCLTLRIEAPIPGKDTVGIEVPNKKQESIYFGDLIEKYISKNKSESNTRNNHKPLEFILGKDIQGRQVNVDIAKMPHALVAGTTGSGKTICLFSIIFSILFSSTPDEVKVIIVDPKGNEFFYFENMPHLATPIICDSKLASSSLKWCVDEMGRRFEFLRSQRRRSIVDYNNYARENNLKMLPYILVIIDEYGDLVQVAGDCVDEYVQRLAQKARSAGIHIILATQRPSTDVISGTIKTNIQCRIALKVKNYIDSTTIIDHAGAEKLLGKGDLLYNNGNTDERIQGVFISENELNNIYEYLNQSEFTTDYLVTHDTIEKEAEVHAQASEPSAMLDPLLDDIARFIFRNRKCSINAMMQTYNISFNRANKIVNALSELGVVSSQNTQGKPREVIINDVEELDNILNNKYEKRN